MHLTGTIFRGILIDGVGSIKSKTCVYDNEGTCHRM